MATTQYASYEEVAIVNTYSYTATVVTEQGETTATLTARQDLDCPRRREVACPGTCKCWYTMHYNTNLQAYEPVQCNNCNIALYDIHFVTEPVAEVAAEPVETVEQVQAGIEHIKDVLAAWDAACEEPTVEQVAAKVDELIERVDSELEVLSLDFELDPTKATLTAADYAMATPEQIAAWRAARKAIEQATEATAEPEQVEMDEQDALIAELALEADAQPDRERYFAARSGKYVLLHQRSDGLAVGCSCPSRVKKLRYHGVACKHMTAHNNMLKSPTVEQQQAA